MLLLTASVIVRRLGKSKKAAFVKVISMNRQIIAKYDWNAAVSLNWFMFSRFNVLSIAWSGFNFHIIIFWRIMRAWTHDCRSTYSSAVQVFLLFSQSETSHQFLAIVIAIGYQKRHIFCLVHFAICTLSSLLAASLSLAFHSLARLSHS